MSGHVGSLTPQQEEALSKFKSAVSDIPNKPEDNDYFYLRWLRARKFKVDKAEQMLRNHMTFRAEQGVDTILQDWTPPEVLQKCFPGGFFGEDRDGHPVWYDNYGNMDFRGIQRSCRKEDVFKLKVYHLETTAKVCEEYSKTKGRHIDTITSVIDLEHLSFQKHYYWPGINLFREALAMFEANYPERSKRIIVVRAPKAFPVAFNLIKPFLKSETRDKIDVLGSNWQEELQKYISPDQLPQAYGGTRCEPDPWCSDHLNPGCDVPPEYYLTNQTEIEKEEMDRVVVGRGGCCELEYIRSSWRVHSFAGSLSVLATTSAIASSIRTQKQNKARRKCCQHNRQTAIWPQSREHMHVIPQELIYSSLIIPGVGLALRKYSTLSKCCPRIPTPSYRRPVRWRRSVTLRSSLIVTQIQRRMVSK
ncbi:SEC14-like protein 2 isoform X2 [Halichondria panicea]|uniref:SEC14-like protein 2 isoform X2 n=1 Tax=Halichondria panicea TaxID=6063 RepID=UPI00312B9DA5